MGGEQWQPIADAILLYYKHKGLSDQEACDKLNEKCNPERTLVAARNRLSTLRNKNPKLCVDGRYNLEEILQQYRDIMPQVVMRTLGM